VNRIQYNREAEMNKDKWIFFDLDGTLTDSGPGLKKSFAYVFEKYGIPADDIDVRSLIGPPVHQSFKSYFNTAEELEAAVRDFRVHYNAEHIFSGNSVYEGIEEMLEALTACGHRLTVVTGKPQEQAEQVIAHFGLAECFKGIYGARRPNTNKIETLNEALRVHGCTPDQVTMIGDRKFDLEAAMQGNTDGIGVLWGYGDLDELTRYDNLFLASTPAEITKHFEAQK